MRGGRSACSRRSTRTTGHSRWWDLDIATAMGASRRSPYATASAPGRRRHPGPGAVGPACRAGRVDREPADPAAIDALVARATVGLADDDDPTWAIADRIARLGDVDADAKYLAIDWLDALIRHGDRADGERGRRSGRP